MVALVAIVFALVAVRSYVPSVSDIQALRAEQAQLEASIAELEQRGGKQQISHCGPERRLCVAVQDYAGIYGRMGTIESPKVIEQGQEQLVSLP
jgi:hypothetical protein